MWSREFMPLVALALATAASNSARGTEQSIRGRFLVRYIPIFCKRSPCPRGSYSVEVGGRRVGRVKTIEIDDATAPVQRHTIATFRWGDEPLAIDGSAGLSAQSVFLHADRAIEGEWKP